MNGSKILTTVFCKKCDRGIVVFENEIDINVPFVCPDCKAGRIMRTVIFHTQDMPNKSRKNALLLMSWKSRRNQKTPIVSPVIFDRGAWKNFSGMELDLNNFVFLGWAEMPEGVSNE